MGSGRWFWVKRDLLSFKSVMWSDWRGHVDASVRGGHAL
jgi:hypothetical protein